jgi:dTDP-4-dehydrorhamnose 3,5-epimerase
MGYNMRIVSTALPEVKTLEPEYHEDYRGYYSEVYSARTFAEQGIVATFVQDNHSFSLQRGTLRGIHFQNNPKAQAKLVRCARGTILDVVVDLRSDSPTFKQWSSVVLSADNRKQVWIPRGFGHAFLTLTDKCDVLYKVDEFYEPEFDRAIKWDDPEIGIAWPIHDPIISDKDKTAPLLCNSDVNLSLMRASK